MQARYTPGLDDWDLPGLVGNWRSDGGAKGRRRIGGASRRSAWGHARVACSYLRRILGGTYLTVLPRITGGV